MRTIGNLVIQFTEIYEIKKKGLQDGDFSSGPRKTRIKESVVKKFSDLCELGGSLVNTSSQEIRNNQKE
jgi:hypothetical protein